jgi:hypothetical protein
VRKPCAIGISALSRKIAAIRGANFFLDSIGARDARASAQHLV